MKKAGHSTAKSGSGHIGKTGPKLKTSGVAMTSGTKVGSSSGKIGSSSSKIIGKLDSSPKASGFPSASQKTFASPSFTPSKASKSSTSFGIIWLPTKKRNKHKDASYNSHKNDRAPEKRPTMYGFMSGDSNHAPFTEHKKEEASLLVPESKASTSVAIIGAGAASASEISSDKTRLEEKQDLIKHEEEPQGASGDRDKSSDDYLDNDKVIVNAPEQTKNKPGDHVDSVFLRSPPPHKRRSAPPANEEEEDCGIKCLYYTLQCCDCVLM